MSKSNPWRKVTNEFVVTFAEKHCKNCEGAGYIPNADTSGKPVICSCATLAFRREFLNSPRCRVTVQRVGDRDTRTIWYRNLAEVPENTDEVVKQ